MPHGAQLFMEQNKRGVEERGSQNPAPHSKLYGGIGAEEQVTLCEDINLAKSGTFSSRQLPARIKGGLHTEDTQGDTNPES